MGMAVCPVNGGEVWGGTGTLLSLKIGIVHIQVKNQPIRHLSLVRLDEISLNCNLFAMPVNPALEIVGAKRILREPFRKDGLDRF